MPSSRRRRHHRSKLVRASAPVLDQLEPRCLLSYTIGIYNGVQGEIAESPGSAFTATLYRVHDDPAELAQPLTVPVTFTEEPWINYATPGDLNLPTDLTFDAGESDATLTFTAVDDPYPENYEYFRFVVGSGDGALNLDGAILPSDAPNVWVTAEQPVAHEGGGSALFVFHRDNPAGDLDVFFNAGPGADTQYVFDPPSLPDDYWGRRTIHFADGQSDAPLMAIAVDDTAVESWQDDIWVGPISPHTEYGETPYVPAQSGAHGVVQDDDYQVTVERGYNYQDDSAVEGQDNPAGFRLTRRGDLSQPLTVAFNTDGGSATPDEDYDNSPFAAGQVTFNPGEYEKRLPLDPIDNEEPEWTEDVILNVEADTIDDGATYTILGRSYETDEIVDDDPADVVIQGLPEETEPSPNEIDPGGLLAVNDDDDNGNGIPDNEESQIDPGDDELEPVVLNMPGDAKDDTSVVLSIDPNTASAFRVWDADGVQILGLFGGAGTPVTSVPIDASRGSSQVVYIEAIAPAQTWLVLAADDSPSATRPSNSSDQANAKTGQPADGDLDVATVSHNVFTGWLDEKLEKTQGALVPVNNDDDDYSATGAGFGEDYSQGGQAAGEDDFLPIVIRAINLPNAKVRLAGAGLNVYRKDGATITRVDLVEEFDAPQQDLTLYVEAPNTTPGDKSLTLWVNGKPTRQTITIKPFKWEGPLNVPQYGTYRYTVGGTAVKPPPGGKWLTPDGGVVEAGAGTSAMDVFWAAGPQVGKAIYQARADYIWDLEVNVVEVVVEQPDQGQAFTSGQVVNAGAGRAQATGPGLKWQAKVTFNGPTLNGKADRGVRQMRAGFVQNLTVTSFRGHYANGTTATSALQGNTYWDTKEQFKEKFYSRDPAAFFENADPAQNRKSGTIAENDGPRGGAPTVFNGASLTSIDVVWDFNLYVVALTTDTRGGANSVYANQAVANWQFNGTGSITPNNNFAWAPGNGAGVTAPTAWSSLGGATQPKTTGPRFNDVVNTARWL